MLLSRTLAAVTLLAFSLVALGCGGGGDSEQTRSVVIDGSSTVLPMSEAVSEEFVEVRPDIRVPVGYSGTGGGFRRFARGETDISDASRPINAEEIEACRAAGIDFIELPIAYDGLAVVVHPGNTWCSYLTVEELRELWRPGSQIERWSQIREGFPDERILLFGPGDDSGTFDYFTEAIVGEAAQSRRDYSANEDDNQLVSGVAGNRGGLGYFGYAYYAENADELNLVAIDDGNPDNGDGPIAPSDETIRNGTYQPLSRPLFIYVSTRSLERPDVQEFVEFYLEQAPALAAEVGYTPLPERVYELARERFRERITGSVFEGSGAVAGVSIEDLLQAEQGVAAGGEQPE